MKTLTIILFFLAFSLVESIGQTNPHKTEFQRLKALGKTTEASDYLQQAYPQWNFRKMRGLCVAIDSKERDPTLKGRFQWQYQRKILEAAGVNVDTDTEAQIGEKISQMWKVWEELGFAICNNTLFDVSNGNIIKFAVSLRFDEFLIDMSIWKVDCNKVDELDGRTVLDYVQAQIVKNKGLPSEPHLLNYYKILRDAGARHKSEL
jgi:hypothetical protein